MSVSDPARIVEAGDWRAPSTRAWGVCVLMPLLFPVVLYTYWVRAWVVLGVWPSPYHPDPKSLGFGVHHLLVLVAAKVGLVAPLYAALLMGLEVSVTRQGSKSFGLTSARVLVSVAFALSYSSFWLLAKIDPGRVVEWFLD